MAKAIGDLRKKKKCLFMMKKNELSHKLVGYSLLNIMKWESRDRTLSKPCTTLAWSEKQLHTTSTSRYNQIEK